MTTASKKRSAGDIDGFPNQGVLPAPAEPAAPTPTTSPPLAFEPAHIAWRGPTHPGQRPGADGIAGGITVFGSTSHLVATVRLGGSPNGPLPDVKRELHARIRAAAAALLDTPEGVAYRQLADRLDTAIADIQTAKNTIASIPGRRAAIDVLATESGATLWELDAEEASAETQLRCAGALARELSPRVNAAALRIRAEVQERAQATARTIAADLLRQRSELVERMISAIAPTLSELVTLDQALIVARDEFATAEQSVAGLVPPPTSLPPLPAPPSPALPPQIGTPRDNAACVEEIREERRASEARKQRLRSIMQGEINVHLVGNQAP